MSPELKDFISRKLTSAISRNKTLKAELISLTSYLPSDAPTSERIYHLEGNKKPECKFGNSYKWNQSHSKYVGCGSLSKCECAKQNQKRNISSAYGIKNLISKNSIDYELVKVGYDFKSEDELFEYLKKYNVEFKDDLFHIGNVIIKFYNFRIQYPKNYFVDLRKNSSKRLIVIFEDEYLNKKHIVYSRLNYILGNTKKLCGARETEVKFINSASEFLNETHIQGNCPAKYKVGAFYKNELVSVMTFGKKRIFMDRSDGYELLRYATKYNIPGIASKMLKFFKKQYDGDITSYCDLRWGNGSVYEKMGFNLISESSPGYWYVKDGIRHYRYKFNKQKLIEMGYDKNKSESKIMSELGYMKIYDAGNLKFEI